MNWKTGHENKLEMIRRLLILFIVAIGLAPTKAIAANTDASSPLRCGPFTHASMPKPEPQTDPEATARFQLISHEATSGPHDFVFLGDSLIQKWDHSLWEQYFEPLRSLNAGINGDRTENLLWRIQNGNLDRQQPMVVVLLIGTNDIGRNRPSGAIAQGVQEILKVLRSRLPTARTLLLGVLPRGELPTSDRRRQVNEVNNLIRACDDRRHVFYANVGAALLDSAGRLTRSVSTDGVHLTERGYALLTEQIEIEFSKILPNR